MLKSFKKKMVQRKYRERSQPEWRKKKGFLEKKIDYQRRSKVFNKKKDMLKILNTKAQLKNPDEFYFKMQNGKMNKWGNVTFQDKKGHLKNDEEFKKIMKTKNQNVLKLHLYRLEKKISKMKTNLHFLFKKNTERIEIDLDSNDEENPQENEEEILKSKIFSKKDLPLETRKNYAIYFQLIHKRDKLKRLYIKLDEEKAMLNSKERRKVKISKNNVKTVKFFRERKR